MGKQDKLDNGKVESIVASLRSPEAFHPGLAKTLQSEADDFERKKERISPIS
jgi:hypothetical protein